MKRVLLAALLLLLMGTAGAEGVLSDAELAPMYEFARSYDIQDEVRQIFEGALTGDMSLGKTLLAWAKEELIQPAGSMLAFAKSLAAPALLLALVKALLPDGSGGGKGAGFLLRLQLILIFSRIAAAALSAAGTCLDTMKRFADAVAPLITFLLTALGMDATAALASPAAALAGSAAEDMFIKYGLPLCRIALCTAIAGNLSAAIDLNRLTSLFRKTANWTAGLATTLFTALLALQGSVAEGMDGIAVRTAKFAVDSAAPVIGSGVSDAWESYISGVMIAKNALGVSGIAALLLACAAPLAACLSAMALLALTAALLEIFGEKEAARAAGQIGGVCQMALSLCTASLAIGMILLGAAMSAGRTLAG